jgi:hypothetical protein
MKTKTLIILFLLAIILLPQSLIAEENTVSFTLNGRPVPQVVAQVNGVSLNSEVLQRDFFAFRFQSKKMGGR